MTVFVIADLHLGDESLCGRRAVSGRRRKRPFANATAMAREIASRWIATVGVDDSVYILGDVGRPRHVQMLSSLPGSKHLVAGNGDDLAAMTASGWFASVSVAKWMPGLLLTHIPVHPGQLRSGSINAHGHLHGAEVGDDRYCCVSVEHTGFAPLPITVLENWRQPGLL